MLYGWGESPSTQAICMLGNCIGFAGRLMNLFVADEVNCFAVQVPLNFANHICAPLYALGGSPLHWYCPPACHSTYTFGSLSSWAVWSSWIWPSSDTRTRSRQHPPPSTQDIGS